MAQCTGNTGISILGLFLMSFLGVVLSDYETEGSLVINSSQVFFHFCEFSVLPVAVYPFNNETLANDVSPHKAVGELVGTTFSPGIHGEPGGSIEVQGRADSYIELSRDAGNLNIKLSITILLYVYPLGSPGPIVNYKKDGHGVQIYETDKALAARVIQRNDGRTKPVKTDRRLQGDQWHFIGMTYNYSSGLVKLWQDGREVAVRDIGSIQIATQFDVRIGARQIVNDNDFFRGRVACLQFYSAALTQRQIEKARIACEPFEPVSTIHIKVRHENKYIEVNDSVSVEIRNDKNLKFNEYKYDMGDGSPLVTTDHDVNNHSYSKHGQFVVQALIYSRCRNETLRVGANVTVEKPVELLGNLTLSCDPVPFPASLSAVLTSTRGTDFKCYWNFSDGHVAETNFADHGLIHKLKHAFNATGTYSLGVGCENRLSRANVTSLVFVQIPVEGLVIHSVTPKAFLSEFRVMWHVESGSDINYTATFANNDLEIFKGQNDSNGWASIRPQDHVDPDQVGPGIFDVTVTATNKVSGILQATETVRIEKEVQPFEPKVFPLHKDIEVKETLSLFLTKINEENAANPVYHIDLGDGREAVKTRSLTTNFSYPDYGDFLVTINASNNVSFYNTSILIRVYKPVLLIDDLTLTTKPTIYLQTSVITVHITRASDVVCISSFDDIPNYSREFDLRAESAWDPIRGSRDENVSDVRFVITRNYTSVGVYSVKVSCKNRLSQKNATIDVTVQKLVTGARLLPIKPVTLGKSINISLELSSGTNASFELDFNGYQFQRKMKELSTFHVVNQDVYHSASFHEFTVTIWNLVTTAIHIRGHVIVENPIDGLEAYVTGGIRDIEVNESVNIAVSLVSGSNPEFVFDFKDGSELFVTHRHAVDYKFNPHSLYVVNVTARNNVSQEFALVGIVVVKPVLALKGPSVCSSPTAVNDTAKLVFRVTEGSDFFCHWQFGDELILNSSYEHLSYYSDGKTTDKRPFQNLAFFVRHNYTSVGIFHVSVSCKNRLSSVVVITKIVIQAIIEGLNIIKVPTQVVGRKFQVTWNILSGTNATFNVTIDRGKVISVRTSALEGFAEIILSTPGQYTIWVSAQNLVSPIHYRSAEIVAEVPVSHVIVNVTYESRDLEMNQNATFIVQLGTGTNPAFVFVFGDGFKLENKLGKVTHKYGFNDVFFTQANVTYQVNVSVHNNVSFAVSLLNVTVHRPVLQLQDVKLTAFPSNVSENARILLTIQQGSDALCVCDFGDGNVRELNLSKKAFLGADRTPVEIFRNQSYQVSHAYKKVSNYNLFIQCRNRLSYVPLATEIVIQEPIRELMISDISPRLFNETLVISWRIVNGTDVSFRFIFANSSFQELGKRRNITVTPSEYRVSGVFRVLVVARNLVSQVVSRATAIIQHPVSIQNVTARITQQGGSRGGYGFLGDYFLADVAVTFAVKAQGSDLSYQWQIDNEMGKFTKDRFINHTFYRVGRHNLTVFAKNMVSDANANITVMIQYAIENPVLESNSPQRVKQPIKFHLSAAQLGTDSCFSVDFGDGKHSLLGHPGCSARNSTANFTVISAVESVKFEHVYSQIGEYSVSLNASNEVSFVQVSTIVEVEYAPCASPDIEIENLGVNSKTASKSFRSDPYVVHTHIHLDCERTNKVKFKWKLLLLNENGAQSTNHDNIILFERELNIPRKVLAYGLYEVHFTAQMALPNTNKYRSTAIGYLRIVPSPLVAKIVGGNLISRGFGKEVKIDATPSKDPDVDSEKDSGLHYTWLCRSIHTQFPKDVFPQVNLRTPYDTTRQPAPPGTAHSAGCYGDGKFVFASSNATLSLNTTGMMENETYVVFVIIRKEGRRALQYQVVEVIQGDPPVSRLDCKQNCADKICPSKRFSLIASCFEGCFGRLIYKWQVYKKVGNKSWQLQTEIGQTFISEVKDPTGPAFTLPKKVLQGSSEYLVRLYGRREKGIIGKTESVFLTNEVPMGGACFSSPTRGDALLTKFHIWCEGWKDPDMPLSYEFYYKNDEGKLVLFDYGFHNSTYSELPLGNPARDYTLEIYIKVLDFYKGAADYDLLLQSVEPEIEEEQLGDMLTNMTSGENSDLSKLVNIGDSQAALRMAGAVNSLLNSQSSKTSSNDTEGKDARKEKRKAVRTAIIQAATSLPVTSLEGLQQSADMIASASMFKDETSTTAMNASNEAFARMTVLLKSSSDDSAGYDAVVSSAESLLSGMGQVLNAAGSSVNVKPKKMNGTKAPPTCGPYDFTCKEVDNEEPGNTTEDEAVELDEESSKSRDAANNIVGMLGNVSGSVLENMLPGEKPSVISTAKLNMAVERSDPDSSGGSSIGDGQAGFRMPSFGKLFNNSSSDFDAPVDKQMAAINENPYTWDKGSSSITGKVVSLSFKSKGQKINVAHLDEDDPIDIFLPRDSPVKPPEEFTYNCSVHRGWRVHKLVVDKNGSAVNVEVSLVGSSQQFVIYVRRGKAPTTTEFDWRVVSPNLTDDMETDPNQNQDQRYPNATEENLRADTTNEDPKALNTSSNSTGALNETIRQENNHAKETNATRAALKSVKIQQSNLTVFLSQRRLHVGTYYVGIKFSAVSLENERKHSTECTGNNSSIPYTLRTLKSRCLYWNEEFQKWKADGCEVGNLTSATQTHCRCTHLTAFGSMMEVAPNPIDFSAVAAGFSSMFETGNVVVFFFVVAMFLIYVLVLVWSRRADKRDTEQAGATPIFGNALNATYHYELTFFTGQRRGAGTTAQVSCTLVGDHSESGICILKDENRPTFRQRSANSFIISVGASLGQITSLRVWHDNYGLSPAWFLKRVLLRDLQSDECVVFICERWFALEEDDGVITRELTPAGEKDLTSFSRLFSSKLYRDFTDAHLWFSVLLKPSRSTFTRAQRASCCLCLLGTAMVSSAMFYGQTGAGDESGSLVLGPIEINLRSIMIGIQCSLVIIPVNVAIVTIFKSVKVKGAGKKDKESDEQSSKETISTAEDEFSEINETSSVLDEKLSPDKDVYLENVQCDIDNSSSAERDNQLVMEKQSMRLSEKHLFFRNPRAGGHKYVIQTNSIDSHSSEDVEGTPGNLREEQDTGRWWCFRKPKKETNENEEKNKAEEKKKKKAEGFLPYWCLYIAWFLCITASFASALFTLFYSMMWGKEKSNQWFFSMVLTFSQDTFINQPAKVVLLSTAYALFIRKSDEESEAEQSNEDPRKGQDEEWLHDTDILDTDDRQKELLRHQPPDESKLSALRETKIREKQLKNKFMKLFDYLFVLLVLVLVSYGNRDPQSFLMRNSMEQEFIHPLTVSYPQGLDDVNNLPLFLKWGEQSLIPHLYEQDWYNGDKIKNKTGFTSGRVSKRLGRMRLRQSRIQNGSCTVHKLMKDVIPECNPPYTESYEDTRMYRPGWRDGIESESALGHKRSALGQLSPWVYLDPTESNSSLTIYGRIAFYPAGGYVAELGDNVEESMALINYLKSTRWLDRYTRSVIIEGAIYNPNTNLIGVVETAVEVTSATAFIARVDFKIFRLFARLNSSYAFNSACEILFFVIVLYTLYTIIKGIYSKKKEYFRQTISWLDMIFLVNGFAIVVVYIARETKLKSAVATLKNDQEWFINFFECALYNEATVYLYAFADFIAILKFINFLSFTRCVQLLSTTIYRSLVELQSFAVMLLTIYMAYASMAYTIYGPYLEDYRSVSATLASLTSIVMGVFDHTDFTSQTDYKAVGYFFFVTFSCSMMFIFTNVVITIINVVHKAVSSDEEIKKNDVNFFNIIMDRLLIFAGFRGPPTREEPVIEEPSIGELQWNWHVQYMMENQLDRLNGLVNSIYTHDEMEEISILRVFSAIPEVEHKPITGYQGDQSDVLSNVAAGQTKERAYERGNNDRVNIPTQGSLFKENEQKLPDVSTSEPKKTSIETITDLITKKTEELERFEEEGDCDETERLHRVKVISCLQDLLNKAMGSQDRTIIFRNHDEESEI